MINTGVRWLSRGNMVAGFAVMKDERRGFFSRNQKDKSTTFSDKISDSKWMAKLTYLNAIFFRLNAAYKAFQGELAAAIHFIDRLK